MNSPDAEEKFPEAVALLKKAESLKAAVEGQDAQDIESVSQKLKVAMRSHDRAAVSVLSEELDDILFYVQ